jgi:glycine cleavage system H protein
MPPADLRYTRSHEWVKVDGDSATIGITSFATEQLTDLVFLELPKVGRTLKPGDAFGVIESVKSANDLYAPVAGEVTAVNSPLADDLAKLSADPFGAGWLVKLKLSDPAAASSLLDAAAYKQHCDAEQH